MKIAIIGCGNMGMAFANSFIQYNLVQKEHLLLIEKNKEILRDYQIDAIRTKKNI